MSDITSAVRSMNRLRSDAAEHPATKPPLNCGVSGVSSPSHASQTVFVPFPLDTLPGAIRDYIASAARAQVADNAFVAVPMLAALGGAIGNGAVVQAKSTWAEPPVIWAAVVAMSGTGKSPAIDIAMRHLKAAQEQMYADHTLLAGELDKQKAEGVENVRDAPPCRRLIVSDTTIEALAQRLAENPEGLILCRDELSAWVSSFGAYKSGRGGDAAAWIEVWAGRPLTVDRKGGRPIHISRAGVSIVGGVQPGVLERVLGRELFESGLVARMLLVNPPDAPRVWTDAQLDPLADAAAKRVFSRLLRLRSSRGGEPLPIHLGREAEASFRSFYNEHNAAMVNLSEDERACWAKLTTYTLRFSLIIELAAWAETEEEQPPTCISAEAMASAIRLAGWFGNEARRVYSQFGESEADRSDRLLIEWIRRRGGSATARDLSRGPAEYRREPDRAQKALERLARQGWGVWGVFQDPRGGRPTDRLTLVSPSVSTLATPATLRRCDETPGNHGNAEGFGTAQNESGPGLPDSQPDTEPEIPEGW